MAIWISETPAARVWAIPWEPEIKPTDVFTPSGGWEWGEAINAPPYEAEMFLCFTTALGKVDSVYYSLVFQLRKWGYVRYKIDESIFVAPTYKTYYDATIAQKEQLQATIKAGLASIAQAIADFELVWHDLRKYKEYLDYFKQIEEGKKLIKQEKKEEGEKKWMTGNTTLKAIFIDQVDVHTGEGIALKLIAPRWPTIIVDFLGLSDEDIHLKEVAKKYEISDAQAGVLVTKNKLYIEWRDNLFKPTVKDRYERLLGLVESRRRSIIEYRNMLRPTVARFKMINDALESPAGRAAFLKAHIRPDAQPVSHDYQLLWAWRPFAPAEKYKVTRESMDNIPALEAGFNGREVEELKKANMTNKGIVFGLPLEPSVDRIVREYVKKVEQVYGVKITTVDLFDARQMLVDQFRYSMSALSPVKTWVWSPMFVFINFPVDRSIFVIPGTGETIEDVEYNPYYTSTYSQNLIICRCLELIAKQKQMENYIDSLLGEYGVPPEKLKEMMTLMPVGEKAAFEYPEVYTTEEELKKKEMEEEKLKKLESKVHPKIQRMETSRKVRRTIGKFFANLGIKVQFFRAAGPYEFMMQQRLSKFIQREPGGQFHMIRDFLETKYEVPGMKVEW
jgi:hypothetical protein